MTLSEFNILSKSYKMHLIDRGTWVRIYAVNGMMLDVPLELED